MTTHIGVLAVFAFFVSLVFAMLLRDDPRSQIRTGAMLFAGFLGGGVILGWLLYPLPL